METAQEQLGEVVPHDDPNTVQLEIYRNLLSPEGKPTGYLRRVGTRSLSDILEDLIKKLREDYKELDYFGFSSAIERKDREQVTWPEKWRWIACYAVTGGSEGHYIHVEVVLSDDTRILVFIGKTFQGMAHAFRIANKCAMFLGA